MDAITRKTLLYKTGVPGAGYCLNHVQGCSHGCKYPCYAYLMKRRCGVVKDYEDWRRPRIVGNALELLEKEIQKYRNKVRRVHLCLSTDPFMFGQDEIQRLSLRIIEKLNRNGIPCTVLTKGVLPGELADTGRFHPENVYGITLVSLSEEFRRAFEPGAAGLAERIEALVFLHGKGFRTWVSMEPYPTPNFIRQSLPEILRKISFVDEIMFGRLNYSEPSARFKHAREFYRSQTSTVIQFCRRHDIDCHLTEGA